MDHRPGQQRDRSQTPISVIANVEAVDDITVKITFNAPRSAGTFRSPAHTSARSIRSTSSRPARTPTTAFSQNPIGTGPYMVDSFTTNDQVIYVDQRELPRAEQAVLREGQSQGRRRRRLGRAGRAADRRLGLRLEPAGRADDPPSSSRPMARARFSHRPGTAVERLLINFSDPNKEVDGQRSENEHAAPVLLRSRPSARRFALATDRETIADQFYLGGDPASRRPRNILTGIAALESPNTTWEFNLDKAARLLDEAGWMLDGDIRKKDGVELKVDLRHHRSTRSARRPRPSTSRTGSRSASRSSSSRSTPASSSTALPATTRTPPTSTTTSRCTPMARPVPSRSPTCSRWYGGKDGENIAQKANGWSGINESRYHSRTTTPCTTRLPKATDPEAGGRALHPDERHPDQRSWSIIPLVAARGRKVRDHQHAQRRQHGGIASSRPSTGTSRTGIASSNRASIQHQNGVARYSPPRFLFKIGWLGGCICRWRPEAAGDLFDVAGKVDRCAVLQVRADNLDADRQPGGGQSDRRDHCRQVHGAERLQPGELIAIRDRRVIERDLRESTSGVWSCGKAGVGIVGQSRASYRVKNSVQAAFIADPAAAPPS